MNTDVSTDQQRLLQGQVRNCSHNPTTSASYAPANHATPNKTLRRHSQSLLIRADLARVLPAYLRNQHQAQQPNTAVKNHQQHERPMSPHLACCSSLSLSRCGSPGPPLTNFVLNTAAQDHQ
eukprot:GHUV01023040.1.p1 GENE.GHUV01023040.1~~GHUV01023040.1.p1  ORF type:complete len:122 (-),score=14.34 GHUV01023040.1:1443-1808(-)